MMRTLTTIAIGGILWLAGCQPSGPKPAEKKAEAPAPPPAYFQVDAATAGTVSGTIRYVGKAPKRAPVDMSNDPACQESHPSPALDNSVVTGPNGGLSDVFVYVKHGLEGKRFQTPETAVTIDQKGCWFGPHVFGIQTGQTLLVTNSDPVTHNIHPLAKVNREWNHSQGEGDPPLRRKFLQPEVLIAVKCNIHSWMHAFIGVVEHPYFAVTGADGAFKIANLPPGQYVVEAVHGKFGAQEMTVTVAPGGKAAADYSFKGN